jgi:hypothetical protein
MSDRLFRLALPLVLVAVIGNVHAQEPTGDLAKRLAGVQFEPYAKAPGYSEGPTWRRGEVFFCSGALLRVNAQGKGRKGVRNRCPTFVSPKNGS